LDSKVSIIIPTKGDRESIKETLTSLEFQKRFQDFEVVVISDKHVDLNPHDFKNLKIVIDDGPPGLKRNLAAKLSNSDILVFIDDDVIVGENWLHNIIDFFIKNPNADVVGGPNLTPQGSRLKERASGYILSSFLGTAHMSARYSTKNIRGICDEGFLTSCNLAVKRKTLLQVDGFPEDIFPGEETIFLYKLRMLGFKLYYEPSILVYHYRRPLFIPHMKQIFSYGKGKGVIIRRFGLRTGPLSILPLVGLLYIILTPLLGYLLNSIEMLIFYGLSMILVFSISLVESIRIAFYNRDYKVIPFLVLGFIAHHISYGLGVLSGMMFSHKK
jgi:GT2 family glycosyltransferase